MCGLITNGVVDLGYAGCYWEGGVLNSCERFGYGKEFNEDNKIVYEGFMFGDRRIYYGKNIVEFIIRMVGIICCTTKNIAMEFVMDMVNPMI